MPPHARMSAAQMLLMRAAVAAFWEQPYERRLVHWGTRVHDDFMLPHYVEQDFADVLEELGGLRLPLRSGLVRAAFRVPLPAYRRGHGARRRRWNCATRWSRGTCWARNRRGGGTVRYVDSSVERVQARVSGWVDERFVLACNGRAVPLTPTEREGEYRRRRALQGVAAAERAASDDRRRRRRWCSTSTTAGPGAAWAA